MKTITIIDAYVSSLEKENLLRECITSCRKLGTDIMLVTHCALPKDIVELVDYYIFDKDNRFNQNSIHAFKSIGNTTVFIPIKESHEYPIVKSMRNAFILAKGLGYDFFYFTEFDLLFSDSDIEKLKQLQTQLTSQSKDFIFFQPINAAWYINNVPIYNVYYETNFFAGKMSSFMEVFDSYFPHTLEEYNRRLAHIQGDNPNCLEFYFFDAFSKYLDKTILIKNHTKEYLKDSRINVSSYQNTKCMIMRSTNQEDYLYITNENEKEYTFKVYLNGQFHSEYKLSNKSIDVNFALIRLIQNCDVFVEIFESEYDCHRYTLQYNKSDYESFINNGYIEMQNVETLRGSHYENH
jgi:hypothetical protein